MSHRAHLRKPASLVLLASLGVSALALLPAGAEHFDMIISVKSQKDYAESPWDTYPPPDGRNPRPSVTAVRGEELQVEWRARSEYPHGTMKNVIIRLFAVRMPKVGAELPEDPLPRIFDNTITGDFLPKHSARGSLRFRFTEPGVYLVRLQDEGTMPEHDHDHFAALDVKVE